jgi:hypothetical protein
MRMKAGAPTSSGSAVTQSSPMAQSIARTGAQIRRFDPSKSPPSAGDANATARVAQMTPSVERMLVSLIT